MKPEAKIPDLAAYGVTDEVFLKAIGAFAMGKIIPESDPDFHIYTAPEVGFKAENKAEVAVVNRLKVVSINMNNGITFMYVSVLPPSDLNEGQDVTSNGFLRPGIVFENFVMNRVNRPVYSIADIGLLELDLIPNLSLVAKFRKQILQHPMFRFQDVISHSPLITTALKLYSQVGGKVHGTTGKGAEVIQGSVRTLVTAMIS